VQRFFAVNKYNPLSCYSLELKEALDECIRIIQAEMKNRSLDFMDEFKYFFADDPNFDRNNNEDNYLFQIIVEGKVVIEGGWSANIYPAKIRYDVNIKKYISRIIGLIQFALSLPDKRLTTNFIVRNRRQNVVYANYDLMPQVDDRNTKEAN
jgi:hypothetical protein